MNILFFYCYSGERMRVKRVRATVKLLTISPYSVLPTCVDIYIQREPECHS